MVHDCVVSHTAQWMCGIFTFGNVLTRTISVHFICKFMCECDSVLLYFTMLKKIAVTNICDIFVTVFIYLLICLCSTLHQVCHVYWGSLDFLFQRVVQGWIKSWTN